MGHSKRGNRFASAEAPKKRDKNERSAQNWKEVVGCGKNVIMNGKVKEDHGNIKTGGKHTKGTQQYKKPRVFEGSWQGPAGEKGKEDQVLALKLIGTSLFHLKKKTTHNLWLGEVIKGGKA